jgi:hypothetical protein
MILVAFALFSDRTIVKSCIRYCINLSIVLFPSKLIAADAGLWKTEMTDWVPDLEQILGPRYLAFVFALDADIAAGRNSVLRSARRTLPSISHSTCRPTPAKTR